MNRGNDILTYCTASCEYHYNCFRILLLLYRGHKYRKAAFTYDGLYSWHLTL